MSTRLAIPARRNYITQKVRIAGQRTLYISVHDDNHLERAPSVLQDESVLEVDELNN